MKIEKIGFGGGCHWCTEAYFQAIKGVEKVEQGWISSVSPNAAFSEAVLVHYDASLIPLNVLIAIHLHTHAATKKHVFRNKYRSAVYVCEHDCKLVQDLIDENQSDFTEKIITLALPFQAFKINIENQQNYFRKNKENMFCQRYIRPKLKLIQEQYSTYFQEI